MRERDEHEMTGSGNERPFRDAFSVSPFTEGSLAVRPVGGASAVRGVQQVLGGTEVFARCNTTQASLEHTLQRARLSAELGLDFNPEFGLWHTYGDITHQPAPDFRPDYPQVAQAAPWHDLTLAQMRGCLTRYGAVVAEQVLATGARVGVWDVGNEVELGVPGAAVPPVDLVAGRFSYHPPDNLNPAISRRGFADRIHRIGYSSEDVAWLRTELWPYVAELLGAFADGVRSIDPAARFSTHTSGLAAVSPEVVVEFFDTMRAFGFPVEDCATSYYPTSHPGQGLELLQATIDSLGEPLFLAEFGYPAQPMGPGSFPWNHAVDGYSLSEEGQAAFYRDLRVLRGLSGVRWWAPDYCFEGWGPMSVFTPQGEPRPVLRERGPEPARSAFLT
jgi:hypothetical protein